MRFKPSINKDARILLKAGGTETLAVEKLTETTNAAVQVQKTKLEVDGTAADGLGVYHSFYVENDAAEIEEMGRIQFEMTDVSDGTEDSCFKFYTMSGGTLANRLTIDTSGSLSGVGDLTFAAAQSVSMIDNNADAWAVKDATANEYLVFDTTTGALRVELNQTVKVANTMDILAATVGGSDLGGTSNEWGSVYLASGKGVYFGSAQECNLLEASGALQLNMKDDVSEAFSIQTESGASEYFIITTSNGAETISLGCTTADEVAQNTTIQAGNDVVIRCGTTAADTLKLQAYDIDGTAYADIVSIASHATDPTLTLAATGGITVSSATTFSSTIAAQGNITMAAGIDILCTNTGSDLGSTSSEWGNIYVGDQKGISFGADQDVTLLHDNDKGVTLTLTDNDATAFKITEAANVYLNVSTVTGSETLALGSEKDITVTGGAGGTVTLTTGALGSLAVAGVDNCATCFTVKEAANSYITVDTTTGSEIMTLGSEKAITIAPTGALTLTNGDGANLTIQAGQTNADKLYLDAYDTTGAYDHIITITSANDPTISIAADGGITLASALTISSTVAAQGTITMASGIDILSVDTGSDLGSTGAEWGNVYVGDSKGISFGADQDQTLIHDGTSGLDLSVADNDAGAFVIKQGVNAYLTIVTSDDVERVTLGKVLAFPAPTVVDMNDVAHALIYGTAGANQTQVTSNILLVDPNSVGGSEVLTLPAVASSVGVVLHIWNTAGGAEEIVVKDVAAATICTIDQSEGATVWCDGTNWFGGVLKAT